jgi:Tol biopolymer transport system component
MRKTIITILFCVFSLLNAQSFGQNKVQYRDFDWKFISSPNFDVYYYGDEIDLANFTMAASIEAYEQIAKHLRWNLKKRVSIMVYHSHNEFQQTNVVGVYMQEGIGGVTELFKNRVVIPFEGDYKGFRHVIHHELVHAMINDLIYGGRMQNVVSNRIQLTLPLWVNEGLAEYLSSNWDTEADMIIRDLAINERIPTIRELEYFLAYKGGQSVWRFIASKYGREKIGEIFQSMKRYGNAEKGFEDAIGMDFEELTEQWHKYIKKEYYPDIDGRDEVKDISIRLTDHKKNNNFYNVSPTVSPDGSKIAVLSDRSGYMDIYIIDAGSGKKIKKLVKGSRSINFEELKFLQPGISWSPDSDKIVIAAKAGASDALYLIDIDSDKQEKIAFDLDGVFTASWSPNGEQLAFVGNEGGASDIYIYEIASKKTTNLTNDVFSDTEPSWSPNGEKIVFISDRGIKNNSNKTNARDMIEHNYNQSDVFIIDLNSNNINQITNTVYNENYPIFSNTENKLFYTGDYQGTWNLFRYNLDSRKSEPITNLLTGLFQLSLTKDDGSLVFSGYSSLGWDVYRLSNPLTLKSTRIEPTNYIANQEENDKEDLEDLRKDKRKGTFANTSDYSNYIFAWEFENYNKQDISQEPVTVKADSSFMNNEGDYVSQAYKTKFSLDVAQGNIGYNNVFGHQGLLVFYFSDLMGDHQLSFAMESQISLTNSDYFLNYAYLKQRMNYYFSLFHQADFFFAGYTQSDLGMLTELTARMRHFGFSATASRPINRFHRIDVGVIVHNLDYKLFQIDPYMNTNNILQDDGFVAANPTLSYIYDNTVNGYTGPIDGFRQNTTLELSPAMGDKGISYQKIKVDLRKYQMINRDYSFAGRMYFGTSTGKNPQKYFLGGMQNWLLGTGTTNGSNDGDTNEARWRNVILDSQNNSLLQDIYFSEFAYPLRGARFSERFGTNVLLANLEFRFPLIQYLALGFPLKMVLGNIRGHVFMDIGAAWDDKREFTDFAYLQTKYGNNLPDKFSPWVRSIGYGIKLPIFTLWRIEAAYDWDDDGFSKPQWYLSIGYDW